MTIEQRLSYLRIALAITGIMCFCVYPLMLLWPSGWTWHVGYSDYPMMIVGVYATLGVFLLRAVRDPMQNLSLIWFTVWSSLVHALIMTYQALADVGQHGHLMGDVPALLLIAIVLAALTPRSGRVAGLSPAA
jgi:FtsH-binding integral membrane protein